MDSSTQAKVSRRARSEDASPTDAEFTPASVKPPFWKRALRPLVRFVRRNLFTVVPFVILLLALGYYYYQYQHILAQNTPNAQSQAQIQKAIANVEKLMVIKDDSNAQLATITDTSKLVGQKFFADAKNGDELILFPGSQQAVLYRPSISKIIAVGPFTPQTTPATPASNPVSTSPFNSATAKPASTSTKAR